MEDGGKTGKIRYNAHLILFALLYTKNNRELSLGHASNLHLLFTSAIMSKH